MSSFEPEMDGTGDASVAAVRISTAAMVVVVAFLFMVVVFIFFFYLYARRRLRYGRDRFVFSAASPDVGRRGLDAAALAALPATVYSSADFKDRGGLECAVCLTELADGEAARVLPTCGHGFHLECIDMWFHSRATCPLCRRRVVVGEPSSPKTEPPSPLPPPPPPEASPREPPAFPTNVLIWGGRGQVGSLVIEIPRRAVGAQVSPSTPSAAEESWSPVSARFRSLRRLWSQGRRAGPSSTEFVDVEQGISEGSAPPPKTPAAKQ
ncbi:E3 ubiquitin-protein ligase EL5-like [Curcuma longa]|uniref:E3 ubiquitin-protein ligase EL5-like n=1 Tax=Curcuma longa TaxID=136217 RepID=UPI003D9EF28D